MEAVVDIAFRAVMIALVAIIIGSIMLGSAIVALATEVIRYPFVRLGWTVRRCRAASES